VQGFLRALFSSTKPLNWGFWVKVPQGFHSTLTKELTMRSTLRLVAVAFIGLILSTSFAMASINLDVEQNLQVDFEIEKEVAEFLPVPKITISDAFDANLEVQERMPDIKLVSTRSFSQVATQSFDVGWRSAA